MLQYVAHCEMIEQSTGKTIGDLATHPFQIHKALNNNKRGRGNAFMHINIHTYRPLHRRSSSTAAFSVQILQL